MTLSACARFAAMPGGSAEAVFTVAKLTAVKIAARMVRIAGACRLLELITVLSARARRPHGGAGPSQAWHPSRLFGHRQRLTEPKTDPRSRRVCRTNMANSRGKLVACAPRADRFTKRCGAARDRAHGLSSGRFGAREAIAVR